MKQKYKEVFKDFYENISPILHMQLDNKYYKFTSKILVGTAKVCNLNDEEITECLNIYQNELLNITSSFEYDVAVNEFKDQSKTLQDYLSILKIYKDKKVSAKVLFDYDEDFESKFENSSSFNLYENRLYAIMKYAEDNSNNDVIVLFENTAYHLDEFSFKAIIKIAFEQKEEDKYSFWSNVKKVIFNNKLDDEKDLEIKKLFNLVKIIDSKDKFNFDIIITKYLKTKDSISDKIDNIKNNTYIYKLTESKNKIKKNIGFSIREQE